MNTVLPRRNIEKAVRRREIGLDPSTSSASVELRPTGNFAVAFALAKAGLAIFPADESIVPTREIPNKISKKPLVAAWRDNSTSDLEQIRRWWRRWPSALPAIDCGKSDLLVVDSDRHGGPDGPTAWDDLVRKEGGLPENVLIVETANGGRHVYFRADGARGNSAGLLPAGIDVRADGGYVIGPGAGVDDGRRWSAHGGFAAFITAFGHGKHLSRPPDWLKMLLGGTRNEGRDTPTYATVFPSVGELRKAVETIPNDKKFDSRDEWRNVVAAIKHEALLQGEETVGFEIAREWSAEWDDSEDADTHFCQTWDSLKRSDDPKARTGRTVLRLASEHGYRLPIPEKEFEDERSQSTVGKIVARRRERSTRLKMRLEDIESAASLALTRTHEPLIEGVLDEGAMSVAYGPTNVGKTFVVLDMAFAVATGRYWNGLITTRGLVIYVAAEGGFGVNQRLLALLQKSDREAGEGAAQPLFALVKYPIDLRTDDVDTDELCRLIEAEETVRGVKCAWVIVDTLSRAMSGGDENSSVDMSRVVQAADTIRNRTGAHFTFVHHTGKDIAKGARGHSSLRAATDTELEVRDGRLSTEKQRDMRIMEAFPFTLKQIELGNDPNGRPITSAVVEWGKAAGGRPTRILDLGEAAFVAAVESALADHGVETIIDGRRVLAVDREHVRRKFYAACSSDKTADAKRSAFNRSEKSKAVATIVSSHDDGLTHWICLNRDYVFLIWRTRRKPQREVRAFGRRSSGQPYAADRKRSAFLPLARRSLRLRTVAPIRPPAA